MKQILLVLLLASGILVSAGSSPESDEVTVETEEEQTKLDTPVSIHIAQNDQAGEGMEEFVPTSEWQKVKEGQAIPRGLHVRLNLQTGEREAKLLDPEDAAKVAENEKRTVTGSALTASEIHSADSDKEPSRLVKMKEAIMDAMKDLEEKPGEQSSDQDPSAADPLQYWQDGGKEGMLNMDKKHFTRDELKQALKKFKATTDEPDQTGGQEQKHKFRNIEELKAQFEKMKMSMKTDYEILQELYQQYRQEGLTDEERLTILTDLEYYLHQIDNARDFTDMGGLALVMKDLNHTSPAVRSEAAFVIGSAAQSNPRVQVKALEGGTLHCLIRMLLMEQVEKVRSRALYALSSLVRQFPYAQQLLIKHGGLAAMSQIFQETGLDKLKVKAVNLINDLMLEQKSALKQENKKDDNTIKRVAQYKQVLLVESLTTQGWCDIIPTLLPVPEHDLREKVLVAMTTLMEHCQASFTKFHPSLEKLKTEYEELAQTEIGERPEEQYYTEILHSVTHVIKELSTHDEL